MKYVEFDQTRPMDLVLIGRVAIDFNPVDYFHPLSECTTFKKYVGGSPANIAVGITRHGKKAGFIGKVSDDQFGEYVVDFLIKKESIHPIFQNVPTEKNLDSPLQKSSPERKAVS